MDNDVSLKDTSAPDAVKPYRIYSVPEVFAKIETRNQFERTNRKLLVELGFLSERDAAFRDLADAWDNFKQAFCESLGWGKK